MYWAKEAGAGPASRLLLKVTGGLPFDRTVVVGRTAERPSRRRALRAAGAGRRVELDWPTWSPGPTAGPAPTQTPVTDHR